MEPIGGKRFGAELIGTLWLVLGGCGTAVMSDSVPTLGVGYLGVALAFGPSAFGPPKKNWYGRWLRIAQYLSSCRCPGNAR